jgi:hypothetical protein
MIVRGLANPCTQFLNGDSRRRADAFFGEQLTSRSHGKFVSGYGIPSLSGALALTDCRQ